jgi:flagellar M-ring protein FliF
MHGAPVAASQLPAMVSALAKANLKGYEIRGTSIMVPRGQEPAYLAALADAKALPEDFETILSEPVRDVNIFESSHQGEQRAKIAKQRALAMFIRSMKGIENAYVLYDVDTKSGLNREKLITATASVKPVGSSQLEEARVSAIRHVVASAIAGLKPENVTVSDLNGRTWYANPDEDGGGEEDLYVSRKRMQEQDLRAKILNALCFIPNVTVEATVELDRERIARMKRGRRSAAQLPNTAAVIGGTPNDPRDGRETSQNGGLGPAADEQVEKLSAGLTPVSARVSVGVPASYLKKVWRERHPDPPGQDLATPDAAALDQISAEESAKIRRHVAQLLPPTQTTADQVTVTTFEDLQTPAPPPPSAAQQAWSWLAASWRTVGLLGLVLVCLLWLRLAVRGGRTFKSGAGWQSASTSAAAEPAEDDAWQQASRVPPPHWRRPADPVIHRQLSELVEADPETAAGILRNWIGQAS